MDADGDGAGGGLIEEFDLAVGDGFLPDIAGGAGVLEVAGVGDDGGWVDGSEEGWC